MSQNVCNICSGYHQPGQPCKSPTPAVEGTMGTCCVACTPSHKTPHVEQKICVDWKPLAPSDSQGTKDKAQKFAEGAYALLSLGDHAKLPNTFVAVLAELYRNSVAAPSLNSVDTPAPVPERTNDWKESAMRQLAKQDLLRPALANYPEYLGWDVCEAAADLLAKLAAPVPEPEGKRLNKQVAESKGDENFAAPGEGLRFNEPPARKDELGDVSFDDVSNCEHYKGYRYTTEAGTKICLVCEYHEAPQASPEAPAKEDEAFEKWWVANHPNTRDGEFYSKRAWMARARLGLSGRAE